MLGKVGKDVFPNFAPWVQLAHCEPGFLEQNPPYQVFWRPSHLGWRPSLVGWRPLLVEGSGSEGYDVLLAWMTGRRPFAGFQRITSYPEAKVANAQLCVTYFLFFVFVYRFEYFAGFTATLATQRPASKCIVITVTVTEYT